MVSRVEGVQHKKGAKVARSKFQRCCKNCCCSSHCRLADHEAIGVLVSPQQVEFPGIEDMSYSYETSEFEEEISHIGGRPSHVSYLCYQHRPCLRWRCTGRHRCTWSGAWLQLTIARVYIALWPQGSCLDRARANFKVHLWNLRIRTIWWCAVMLRRALFYEHEYFCCGESPWTATESERANIYDEIFILYNSIMFPLVV